MVLNLYQQVFGWIVTIVGWVFVIVWFSKVSLFFSIFLSFFLLILRVWINPFDLTLNFGYVSFIDRFPSYDRCLFLKKCLVQNLNRNPLSYFFLKKSVLSRSILPMSGGYFFCTRFMFFIIYFRFSKFFHIIIFLLFTIESTDECSWSFFD